VPFESTLNHYKALIEKALDTWLTPADTQPESLHQAIRYSQECGGKRLRPTLVLAAHSLFPSDEDPLPAAAAVECIHTSSLIHDDLPCMDDSDLRRGHPTCHKQFDEATALLAGDALLIHAFTILSRAYQGTPELAIKLVEDLSHASGSTCLIGGQVEDLLGEKLPPDEKRLEFIHLNKTAALITASLRMGLRLCNPTDEQLKHINTIGHHLGLAFQIVDDILDQTETTETLGKTAGLDEKNDKLTYPRIYGLDGAKAKAREHTQAAIAACEDLGGNNEFLIALAQKLENRTH